MGASDEHLYMGMRRLAVAARTVMLGVILAAVLAFGAHTDSGITFAALEPRVVRESTSTIEIRFSTPRLQVETVVHNGRSFQAIDLKGFGTLGEPGTPAVPVQRRMVAVPPGAAVDLQVDAAKPVVLAGKIDPLPVPYGEPVLPPDDPAGLPIGVAERYAANAVAYASEAWMPTQVVRITDRGAWRGIDFVTLEFTPVQFQPGLRAARYVPWAKVRLSFDGVRTDQVASFAEHKGRADRLSGIVDELFLNPGTARAWQRPAGGLRAADLASVPQNAALAPTSPDRWLVEVDAEGLQKLTYADLNAVGVTSEDPRYLHLRHASTGVDEPVAMWIDGQADGSFDVGDALYFYAPDPASRWSAHAFYWLTLEATPRPPLPTRDVTPVGTDPLVTEVWATHRINPAKVYISYAATNSDKWFHSQILPNDTSTLTFLNPPGFLPTDAVTLTVRLGPNTFIAPNFNSVSASLNGTSVAAGVPWPYSPAIFEFSTTVSSSLIQASNSLRVSTTKIAFLDGADLEYRRELVVPEDAGQSTNELGFLHDPSGPQRFEVDGFTDATVDAFDISDPWAPVRLDGGQLAAGKFTFSSSAPSGGAEYFLAGTSAVHTPVAITQEPASSLWDTAHDVDYLVVSYPDFIPALGPLLTHRENQVPPLSTLAVDVTEVYKEFGDGTPNPEGIYNFVKYAYDNWASRPAYLLLVGDGHYDMRDYLGTGTPNPMPPYLADEDRYIGETAVDYHFTLVDGDDQLGDLLVGRFAVNDASETTAIVDKIIDYETNPPSGAWRRRGLFVADDPEPNLEFHAVSDAVIEDLMPYDWDAVRAYQGAGDPPLSNLDVRDAIVDTLNTDGALFMQYVGHGNPWALGFPSVWDNRRRNDIDLLTNAVYPLSLTWTCWDNYYIHPEPEKAALAEQMLRSPGKGSIATFGPTGLDTVESHDVLTRGFFDAWFNDGVNELGQAVLSAKVYLWENGPSAYRRLLYTFMLHGDPALHLPCELYGDLNGDNKVDESDYALAESDWGQPVGPLGENVTVQHLTRMTLQLGMNGCLVPEPQAP